MVHTGLGWLEASPEGRDWLTLVPQLRRECEDAWGISSAGEAWGLGHAGHLEVARRLLEAG